MRFLSFQICLLFLLASLSACSTIPHVLEQKPVEPLSFSQVRSNPEAYQGRRVRWGGRILQVTNEEEVTWMQVLAVPLDRSGRPREDADGLGRFMVRTVDFLDPAIYEAGREATVVGTINGTKPRLIDKRKVRLLVIDSEIIYLWQRRPRYKAIYYPYYPYWRYSPYWAPYSLYWPYYY